MSSINSEDVKKIAKSKLSDFELDDETALKRAAKYKMVEGVAPEPDPYPAVKPSLLSADHIIQYANLTGMVAPFGPARGEKHRLKAASYEGRIGKEAYKFVKGNSSPQPILKEGDNSLIVEANSIVFVECDLHFRLPPFIAVRFNLQINHVHRGLLLGTGPLVDPGFWGKLCIPLHNLTNEDYEIPLSDGLIWIEFTKTTSVPTSGRPPSNTDWDKIRRFIEHAAKPFDELKPAIPILSSIPDMVEKAEADSARASGNAQKASDEATAAKEAAIRSETFIKRFGFAAGFAGLIGILTLWGTYYIDMKKQFDTVGPVISQVRNDIDRHLAQIDRSINPDDEASIVISDLERTIEEQSKEIDNLRADIDKLTPCRNFRSRPPQRCD